MADIVKVEAELLPSLELPNLPGALATLKDLLARLPALGAQAAAIVCTYPSTPPTDYQKLVELVDQMQDIGKAGEKQMRPLLDIVNEVAQYLHAKRKNQEAAAKAAWEPHAERAAAWKRGEREAAQAEQDRINAERTRRAAESAEKQRLADEAAAVERRKARVAEIRKLLKAGSITKRLAEKYLREAGAIEEADKTKAAADAEQFKANVQTVTVTANVPKVSGRRGTVRYFAEVIDEDALLMAYVDALRGGPWTRARSAYFREFIMANEPALSKEASVVKNSAHLNATIPGVKFTDKDTV
jgi:hypothetical protein